MALWAPLRVASAVALLGLVPAPRASLLTSEPRFHTLLTLPGHTSTFACPTTSGCSAVLASGTVVTVTTEANGVWSPPTKVFSAAAGHTSEVDGFACPSAGDCALIGIDSSASTEATFAVSEANGSWGAPQTIAPPSAVTGPYRVTQWALSCPGVATCTAVGGYFYDNQARFTTAMTLSTSGTWGAATEIPGPGAEWPEVQPESLSCTSASYCFLFEQASNPAPTGLATWLIQTEVGGVWGTPTQPPSSWQAWGDVSCWSPGDCLVVGIASSPTGAFSPSYDLITNDAWGRPRTIGTPVLFGAPNSGDLGALACHGPAVCVAAGSYEAYNAGPSSMVVPGAVTFREGIPSSVALYRLGPGSRRATFDGVMCPTTLTCVAVTDAVKSSWLTAIDVTPRFSRPGPPVRVVIHRRALGYFVVGWDPPVTDGGAPVTGFDAVVVGTSLSCRTTRDACLFGGLVPGHRYRAVVFDTTAKGRSLSASSNWFVPT